MKSVLIKAPLGQSFGVSGPVAVKTAWLTRRSDGRVPALPISKCRGADVAGAARTEEGHEGELYEVTGPRLISVAEMAAELSHATGRGIRHIPISFEEFHANIAQAGGTFVTDVFTAVARETLDGRDAATTDGVKRALGRGPRDFVDFARAAARTAEAQDRRKTGRGPSRNQPSSRRLRSERRSIARMKSLRARSGPWMRARRQGFANHTVGIRDDSRAILGCD